MIVRNNPYIIQGVRSIMSERIGRLFNRRYCHYEGTIHERVTTLDGKEPDSFSIPLTFYHEGYVSESDKRMRATRNLEMLLRDFNPEDPNPYIYFQDHSHTGLVILQGIRYIGEIDIFKIFVTVNAQYPVVGSLADRIISGGAEIAAPVEMKNLVCIFPGSFHGSVN